MPERTYQVWHAYLPGPMPRRKAIAVATPSEKSAKSTPAPSQSPKRVRGSPGLLPNRLLIQCERSTRSRTDSAISLQVRSTPVFVPGIVISRVFSMANCSATSFPFGAQHIIIPRPGSAAFDQLALMQPYVQKIRDPITLIAGILIALE